MLSRRQRILNFIARRVQKPTLAYVQPQWLARKVFSLNAMTIYKTPPGLWTRPYNDRCTLCELDKTPTHGTILYIHGGAFVIGNLRGYRHLIATLARQTGMRGVYVDYRLAPEHPAPAALDDVTAAYEALIADPDSGPVSLVGDSAGGNLVLALMHRILARDLPRPAALVAISPVTDLALQNPSLEDNKDADLLVPMSWGLRGVTQYLAGQDATNPEVSPIHGTFDGAPPTLIQTDRTEVLNDDARRMADHLRAAGAEVTYRETSGLPHVNHLNLGRSPEADALVAEISQFLKDRRPTPAVDSGPAPA